MGRSRWGLRVSWAAVLTASKPMYAKKTMVAPCKTPDTPYFPNATYLLQRADAEAMARPELEERLFRPLTDTGQLKLIDLGVVRVPGMEDFTPEDIPGTSAYMAPEMFAGEPGNEATDIYALGVIWWQLLTVQMTSEPMMPMGMSRFGLRASSAVVDTASKPM